VVLHDHSCGNQDDGRPFDRDFLIFADIQLQADVGVAIIPHLKSACR
jgi:hypothetical protein